MKFRYILFCFSIIFSFNSSSLGKDEDRLFYDAVRAEASGDLDQAITYYLQASKLSHSSNLHGNLANLYFKKEQFGHSILHFRKALLLKPNNNQLSANLDFAHEMAKTPPNTKNFASSYFLQIPFRFGAYFAFCYFGRGYFY